MWGWEPTTTTTHVLRRRGWRFTVVSTTTTETEWDEESYKLMVAYEAFEADRCAGCGQPLSESASPDADPSSWDAPYKYVADLPLQCFSCLSISQAQEPYKDAEHLHSLQWTAERVLKRPPE